MILYGQTSSGKTYTLFGENRLPEDNSLPPNLQKQRKKKNEIVSNLKHDLVNLNYKENLSECLSVSESHVKTRTRNQQTEAKGFGIIPRFLRSLFKEIGQLKSQEDVHFTFEYSFFEIYKEKIYDLISQTYDYVDDGNGKFKQVLKSLNLREKKNNQIVIGKDGFLENIEIKIRKSIYKELG